MSVERDLLGWELDDVLEGYDVDYTVDTCSIDSEIIDLAEISDARDRGVFEAAWDRYANRIEALLAIGLGS